MHERILQISKDEQLSHVGSCLGMAKVLEEIYQIKQPEDIVILDAGHAHLAHLVAQEKYEDKEIKLPLHDIHCNLEDGCEVATGSLGSGAVISLGRAVGNPDRDVYLVLSDGGAMEGSVWEALRLRTDLGINNLKIFINCNGYGALDPIDTDTLEARLKEFCSDIEVRRTNSDFGSYRGVASHYGKIN